MKLNIIYEIWSKLKILLSADKLYSFWRFVLCFFSADYFVHFKYESITSIHINSVTDERTMDLIFFIVAFIIVWFLVYQLLEIPLRLIFHGKVKKKIQKFRSLMGEISEKDRNKHLEELISILLPYFQNYLFKYGMLSSNDISQPLLMDNITKEKEFNEVMKTMYRWILTIIHTLLVALIIWQFYSIWFLFIVLIILLISIMLTFFFSIIMLNFDYIEPIRQKLLKENKKNWD